MNRLCVIFGIEREVMEMAIDIFDQGYSDHVVFDRIVDADRTITLARQAADKAEAAGQLDKAAKLREKADYLEQILQNTQMPDYSDEPDGTPPVGGDSGNDSTNNQTNPNPVDKTATQGQAAKTATTTGTASENSDTLEEPEVNTTTDSHKLPQDIQHIDDQTGSHADGTNKQDANGGGAGGNGSNTGSSSGKSGKGPSGTKSGESDGDGTEDAEGEGDGDGNQANGSGKGGQSMSKEVDPFRTSLGGGAGQQLTPEEELEAIIKRLSSLTGDARKGADRGLQDFFNQISGGDSL